MVVSGRVVCAGNAALDRTFALNAPPQPATSNPARLHTGFGGVARNVAENLARLDVPVALVSQAGNDAGGRALRDDCATHGIDVEHLTLSAAYPTSEYVAIIDPASELVIGASASAAVDALTPAQIDAALGAGDPVTWIFADCNLPATVLEHLIKQPRAGNAKLAIDVVSTLKALRLPRDLTGIDVLFVNEDEARALVEEDAPAPVLAQRLRKRGAASVVLTRGARGALVSSAEGSVDVPASAAMPVDVTGAGDALIAGTLFGLLEGETLADAVRTGTQVARLTIESPATVAPALTRDAIRVRA